MARVRSGKRGVLTVARKVLLRDILVVPALVLTISVLTLPKVGGRAEPKAKVKTPNASGIKLAVAKAVKVPSRTDHASTMPKGRARKEEIATSLMIHFNKLSLLPKRVSVKRCWL